jgi:hypothetical protein
MNGSNTLIFGYPDKTSKGLPIKKIINRFGRQGKQRRQGEKKLDSDVGCRN